METRIRIGLRIKEIRTEKNLTQEAVAWAAEVDRTFMNHVENGRRNASIDTLTKIICQGLGISLRDFFNSDLFDTQKM